MLAGVAAFAAVQTASADGQVLGWGANPFSELPPPPASMLPFTKASAGSAHTVVLRADGQVLAWGYDADGQCDVPVALGSCKSVVAGAQHTVALRMNGTVVCWGNNLSGQCTVPPTLGACKAIGAGGAHTVVVAADGTVVAWGSNSSGQTTIPAGLGACSAVAGGASHTLAIRAGGVVSAWGNDSSGQCQVPADLGACTQVAAGDAHSVALRTDGTVRAWGNNSSGQCSVPALLGTCSAIGAGGFETIAMRVLGGVAAWGSNSNGQCSVPADLGACTVVTAGSGHSVAIRTDGSVRCWGAGTVNTGISPNYGQSMVAADVGNCVAIAGGGHHTVVLLPSGAVKAWGTNSSGQCTVPPALGACTAVTAGTAFSAALRIGGTVSAWGDNSSGQCNVPVGLGTVAAISANGAGNHLAALLADGSVRCWGRNVEGQCNVPGALGACSMVAAGGVHTLALRADGTAAAWGSDVFGQCTVPANAGISRAIAAGGYHSVLLSPTGVVLCFGRNGNGQCTVPTGLGACIAVAAGQSHTVALRTDGTVAAWGSNSYGQCTGPSGLAQVTAVAAGAFDTLALLDANASGCSSPTGAGSATLAVSGTSWQNVGTWAWTGAGPHVPGAMAAVDLGAYGSVGLACDARAGTLTCRSGSSLLIPLDLSAPGASGHAVEVSTTANMAGRIWLLASGALTLPPDLDIPVVTCTDPRGAFDILQSSLPAPAGKFLTLVPTSSFAGHTTYSLRLLDLPTGGSLNGANSGGFSGTAVAAEAMDWNHDGFDDLVIAIDFGAGVPGRLQVLLNDGAGNLGGASVMMDIPSRPTCLSTGNLNGDGLPDVAVGTAGDSLVHLYYDNYPNSVPPFGTGVPLQPSGTPLSVLVIPAGTAAFMPPSSGSVAVGSTSTSSGGTVEVFNSADGSVEGTCSLEGDPSTMGGRGTSIATGGSRPTSADDLSPSQTGRLFIINLSPTGGLQVAQSIDVPGVPALLDYGDIDGDGKPDVITANTSPSTPEAGGALPVLTLFRGSATGFGAAVPIQPSGASSGLDVTLADVDGDGDRDIVCVARTSGDQSQAVLLRVDTNPTTQGGPITIGDQVVLQADRPVLSCRGNLNGVGGDDVFLVDAGGGANLTGGVQFARPYVGSNACPADINHDGIVDGADLTFVLSQWGHAGSADFTGDGVVNGADIGYLLSHWGPCGNN